jgi:hypothetical protein
VLESRVEATRLEAVLAVRDSKGRGLLHLAAKNPTSSTAVKLLLDCGVKVTIISTVIQYIVGGTLSRRRTSKPTTCKK